MRKIRRSIAQVISAAVGLTGVVSVHAADGAASITAVAALTNFHYELVDLAPGDGVAPSLDFAKSGLAGAFTVPGSLSASNVVSGATPVGVAGPFAGPLPTQPMAQLSGDGSSRAQASPGGLSASMAVQISPQGVQSPYGGAVSLFPDGASVGSQASSGGARGWYALLQQAQAGSGVPLAPAVLPDFILSPHTSVTLYGHLLAQVDAPSGSESPFLGRTSLDTVSGVSAYASIEVERLEPTAPLASQGASFESLYAAVIHNYDASSATVWAYNFPLASAVFAPSVPLQEDDFALTFTNDTDAPLQGLLRLNAQVSALLPMAQVPEPSTWSLMGLGLLGGLAVQKRRRQV